MEKKDRTYGINRDNPALSALATKQPKRNFSAYTKIPFSVTFADDFITDLAKRLRIDRKLATNLVNAVGEVLAERALDGKASAFPPFGLFYVRTGVDKKGPKRRVSMRINTRLRERISLLAPLTESFHVQQSRARRKYYEREKAKKETLIASGRQRLNRNDERKRESIDSED